MFGEDKNKFQIQFIPKLGETCCSVRKHRLKVLPNRNNRSLCGADGKPITVRGETDIDIEVNGYHMQARFKIVKNLKHAVIIGIDMLTDHKAMIDGRGCVYFGEFLVASRTDDDVTSEMRWCSVLFVTACVGHIR